MIRQKFKENYILNIITEVECWKLDAEQDERGPELQNQNLNLLMRKSEMALKVKRMKLIKNKLFIVYYDFSLSVKYKISAST